MEATNGHDHSLRPQPDRPSGDTGSEDTQLRSGLMSDASSPEDVITAKVAVGESAMVATAFPDATAAAVEILRAGGNAVDAAVAAAWALSVCEPSGSGLGGHTTLLVHTPQGRTSILDGHSYAPVAVTRRTVNRKQQRYGHRACTVPSTPATLDAATRRFGRLPPSQLLAPAIRLAFEGFRVTKLLRRQVKWCRAALKEDPLATRVFFRSDGRLPKRGAVLRQPELGQTLSRIATSGVEDFYRGHIARTIARDMERSGGLLTKQDLAECALPVEREPLSICYRAHHVISVPPPGGGIQVLLGLRLLEQLMDGHDDAAWYEALALVTAAVFRERYRWPIRPDRLTSSLQGWLFSEERAREIADEIRSQTRASSGSGREEPGETTHLCVVDDRGMIVSLTQSVQSLFGAKVCNPELGFFYNNYLCACPRYRHPSRLGPRATPQSNAAPTLVFMKDGDARGASKQIMLALGAAGSRRITSCILQVISNCVDRGRSLPQAIDAPRVHGLQTGKVHLERRIATDDVLARLGQWSGEIVVKAARSFSMGAVQAIGNDRGGWIGVADSRREGVACGY